VTPVSWVVVIDHHKVRSYRATNDEHPFLFPSNPLYYFICTLSQRISAGVGTSDTIQFKDRGYPRQGGGVTANAVVDLEMGVFGVDAGMNGMI